jgi:CO/xanthine dehydrogenase FAD-binding subunit
MIYKAPVSFSELKQVFQDYSQVECGILAGGTDLMTRWEQDKGLMPDVLIDIKKIDKLFGIRESEDEIIMGALTTIQDIKKSKLIYNEFSSLSEAARQFAGVQIRHRATIGGNICNASPAGDLLPGLYAHKADLHLLGPKGSRSLPISDFIVGPGKTVIESEEIVSEIHLPRKGEKSLFYKLGLRRSMAIAVVNFAIVYDKNSNSSFTSLNIAAGAVAPTIVYLKSFTNAAISGASLDEAVQLVDKDISPINDIRATADYRRTALKNVLKYTFRHEFHEEIE